MTALSHRLLDTVEWLKRLPPSSVNDALVRQLQELSDQAECLEDDVAEMQHRLQTLPVEEPALAR